MTAPYNPQEALASFEAALELNPELKLKPEEELSRNTALLAKAAEQAAADEIDEALKTYALAKPYLSDLTEESQQDLNSLCWNLSVRGHAADVLDACQRAVDLAPNDGGTRDSLALAQALTGNVGEAIKGFKAFVAWAKSQNQQIQGFIPERDEWIDKLERQKLPPAQVFTPEVLEKLKKE